MIWKTKSVSLLAIIVLVAFVLAGSMPAYAAFTKRVSISSDGQQGNEDSGSWNWTSTTSRASARDAGQTSISADGRFVAFESNATNLVTGDTNAKTDIFVRDRQTGTTERVSVSSIGEEGNGDSRYPSISPDGRFVVFVSNASVLVPGDTNEKYDIFIRDRQNQVTERVSITSSGEEADKDSGVNYTDGGTAVVTGLGFAPSVSADGRFVAFTSQASNLVADDTNDSNDVFLRDRETGVTQRISLTSTGDQGNASSRQCAISADGKFVAFVSSASNLVEGDTNAKADVFVFDRQTNTVECASVSPIGAPADGDAYEPVSISADGRYVAFASLATNLTAGGANDKLQVYVRDLQADVTERASVSSTGSQGNSDSQRPSISSDGRYVAFASYSTNLVTESTGGKSMVFVRDRQLRTTGAASISGRGAIGNSDSEFAAVSADGQVVAFASKSTNLITGDTNSRNDIFIRDRSEVPAVDLTVTIEQAADQADPASAEPVKFSVVFSQPVADFATGDVVVAGSSPGIKTAVVTSVGIDKTTYAVAVSGMTDSGTVIARVPAGAAHNLDGDANLASTSEDNVVTYQAPVATPEFDPDGGTFDAPVDVEITCSALGARIYYTTNGQNPTNASRLVPETGIVKVDRSMTLKARAYKTGYSPSAIKSAVFQITGGTNDFRPSPTLVTQLPFDDELDTSFYTESVDDPALACFTDNRKGFCTAWWTVTLSASTIVTATTEGSDYDTILSAYTQDSEGRLHSIICNDNAEDEEQTSKIQFYAEPDVTYYIEVASYYIGGGRTLLNITGTPTVLPVTTATPDGGVYNTDVTVTLTATTPNSPPAPVTYYSIDGTNPVQSEADRYVVPITIDETTVLKVFSVDRDGNAEPMKTILYVVDKVRPSCVASIDPDASFVTPLVFDVEFSEPVTGFDAASVAVTGGTIVGVSGTGKTYSVSVSPTGDSDVSFRVKSSVAADAAGNLNTASNTVTVDRDVELPSCTVTAPVATNTTPLVFNIGFSEAVTGLTMDDSKIAVSGGTKSTLTGSGASYRLTVTSPVEGPVTCRVLANAAEDVFGNGNIISNISTTQYDTTRPTVVVTAPPSPTHETPVKFAIRFSETVSGLSTDTMTVTNAARTVLTGSGNSYVLAITPAGNGAISCRVEAGSAHDAAGNPSRASVITGVYYGDSAPTIKIVTPVLRPIARSCDFVDFTGTAADNIGVTSVSWSTDRGLSGDCTGATEWTARVKLLPGANVITFTATDTASNTTDAKINATYVVISPIDLWRGMTMVSIPVIPDSTDPKVAIGFSANNWLSFDPASNSYFRYPDARTRFNPAESAIGRGFWATFSDPISVVNGTLPDQTRDADIDLKPGWNLIGHPFSFPVTWSLDDIMVLEPGQPTISLGAASSVVAGFAWAWETAGGGSYKLVADPKLIPGVNNTIEPWRGYWLRAYRACTLRIPAKSAD